MSRRVSGIVHVSQEPGPSTSRTSHNELEFYHFTESEAHAYQEHISDSDEDDVDGNVSDEGTSFNLSLFKPAGTKNSRDYYPLRHHQLMFDAWEAAHPTGPSPGAGGNLADLQDGERNRKGGRPPHGLRFIIESAIYGSPEKRLTLREIEIAIVRRFAWFADPKNKGWQNSVRHALSRLPNFQQIKRPIKDGDPGAWWVRTDEAPPNVTPSARSERRGSSPSRLPSSRKLGRKPKMQPWSQMTGNFPSRSPTASASDEGKEQLVLQAFPEPTSPLSATAGSASYGDSYPLPPFFHPETPDRSLPGLRDTGLLEDNDD